MHVRQAIQQNFLLIICIFSFSLQACAAEPLYLVKGGKAVAAIVVPQAEKPVAPKKEVDANGESTAVYQAKYRDYIKKRNWYFHNIARPAASLNAAVMLISGSQLPVVREGSKQYRNIKGAQIHLGRTEFVKSQKLELEREDNHHVKLKRVGEKIVIVCGGKEPELNIRGMGFAAGSFLKLVLDVHHYIPESKREKYPLWTIAPKSADIKVGDLDYAHTPSFLSRDFSMGGWVHAATDWVNANRLSWGARYHIMHNLGSLLPPSKYGKEHPEYYPILNGERFIPPAYMEKRGKLTKDWQPCMSNPQLVDEITRLSRDFFDENPERELISLALNDNYGWCECRACRKANGGVQYDKRNALKYSNLYFGFVNKVAEKLEKTHPGKLVGAMIYENGTIEPPNFKLRHNVVALMVFDLSLFHANENTQKFDTKLVGDWDKVSDNLAAHVWHVDFSKPFYPRLALRSTKDFLTFYHKAGGMAYHGEEYTNFGFDGPKTWITAELLWDVNKDVDALLKQFCDDSFGKASNPMLLYFNALEDAWNENTKDLPHQVWGLKVPLSTVITPVLIEKCSLFLDEALALADNEKDRKRVEHFRKSFTATQYAASYEYARKTCERIARERDLLPGLPIELLGKLNEAAFAREAFGQYLDYQMKGDPQQLLVSGAKAGCRPKPLKPVVCRIASILATRLAKEQAADPGSSQEEFKAGVKARLAQLKRGLEKKLAETPALAGMVKDEFLKRLDGFTDKMVIVPKRDTAPALDGRISAGEWDDAPVLSGFYQLAGGATLDKQAGYQTEVRLGYDDKALYIACKLYEEDVKNLTAVYELRDGKVWRDDCIDFSILPPNTPNDKYYQFIVNPNGAVFDQIGRNSSWHSKLKVKPGIDSGAGAWILEIAIPWEDFGRKAESGNIWRAQFGRSDWKSGRGKYSAWTQVIGSLGNGDYMGILLFE
jgi:hypothetical protein